MDLAGEKAMMMSTTGAEKIREKIIQRRGNELLQRLDGLEAGVLAKASDCGARPQWDRHRFPGP